MDNFIYLNTILATILPSYVCKIFIFLIIMLQSKPKKIFIMIEKNIDNANKDPYSQEKPKNTKPNGEVNGEIIIPTVEKTKSTKVILIHTEINTTTEETSIPTGEKPIHTEEKPIPTEETSTPTYNKNLKPWDNIILTTSQNPHKTLNVIKGKRVIENIYNFYKLLKKRFYHSLGLTENIYSRPLNGNPEKYPNPYTHKGPYNKCIDYKVPVGTEFFSPLDGYVVFIQQGKGLGNPENAGVIAISSKKNLGVGDEFVEIIHVYVDPEIKKGDKVKRGQKLGISANNGYMTSTNGKIDEHLHVMHAVWLGVKNNPNFISLKPRY